MICDQNRIAAFLKSSSNAIQAYQSFFMTSVEKLLIAGLNLVVHMLDRRNLLLILSMLAFSIAISACIKSPESALYSVIVDPFPRDQMTLHPIGTMR